MCVYTGRDVAPAKTARILIVDDSQPFRVLLGTLLQPRPQYLLVGESGDGLEAIQVAGKLQPDIILLDLGLPSMNGMEAAREIAGCTPKSKIIFVTQETCASVAEPALKGYGSGYVVKMDVFRELIIAIDTVLKGGKYVPTRFVACDWAQTPNTGQPDVTSIDVPLLVRANAVLASATAGVSKHRQVRDEFEGLIRRRNSIWAKRS